MKPKQEDKAVTTWKLVGAHATAVVAGQIDRELGKKRGKPGMTRGLNSPRFGWRRGCGVRQELDGSVGRCRRLRPAACREWTGSGSKAWVPTMSDRNPCATTPAKPIAPVSFGHTDLSAVTCGSLTPGCLYELRDGDELLGLDGLAAMALRSAVVEAAASKRWPLEKIHAHATKLAGKAAACAAYVELIRKSKWNVEHAAAPTPVARSHSPAPSRAGPNPLARWFEQARTATNPMAIAEAESQSQVVVGLGQERRPEKSGACCEPCESKNYPFQLNPVGWQYADLAVVATRHML